MFWPRISRYCVLDIDIFQGRREHYSGGNRVSDFFIQALVFILFEKTGNF